MSEDMNNMFTSEQLMSQAQGNATFIGLATIAYLRENNLDINEYSLSVGQRFAPGWMAMQDRGARDIAQIAALNMVSVGGTLESFSGDGSQAEVVISGWPAAEALAFFKLEYDVFESFWNIFQPIAEALGFQYNWQREGDEVTMTFSR